MSLDSGLRIGLRGHAGRCFLAGLPAGHPMVGSLGAASVAGAVRDARAAGVTALVVETVSDFAVLRPGPVTGLRAHRGFRPGEAAAGHRRQLAGLTSRSLAGFADEILRLTEAAGPARVAVGTDLDGNCRPALTGYSQLGGLAGLLRDRGLPADDIRQVLGGNAAGLLRRAVP